MPHVEDVFAKIVDENTQVGLEAEKELADEIIRLKSLKNRKGEALFPDDAQVLRIAAFNVGLRIAHSDDKSHTGSALTSKF